MSILRLLPRLTLGFDWVDYYYLLSDFAASRQRKTGSGALKKQMLWKIQVGRRKGKTQPMKKSKPWKLQGFVKEERRGGSDKVNSVGAPGLYKKVKTMPELRKVKVPQAQGQRHGCSMTSRRSKWAKMLPRQFDEISQKDISTVFSAGEKLV